MIQFEATLTKPNHSRLYEVKASFSKNKIHILFDDESMDYPLSPKDISINKGCPVYITLSDASVVVIEYSETIIFNLANYGLLKNKINFHLQSKRKLFILSTLITFSFIYILFKIIIPNSAGFLVQVLPNSINKKIDRIIMENLSKSVISDSELDENKKAEFVKYFNTHGLDKYDIHFRKGNQVGANAFALAHNTIIITDELVEKLKDKKLILSVVYHEAGHLEHEHVMQSIISNSMISLFSILLLGDLEQAGESLATLSLIFVGSSYLRSFERQADIYAVKMLKYNKYSASCFSEGLAKLVPNNEAGDGVETIFNHLSSHPSRNERILTISKSLKNNEKCQLKSF